jgi:predicted phosphodiesterase
MALLQSFHSAPHAIVQSALAFALENQGTAESLANLADIYQQVSAMLETMPHPRAGSSGAPAIVQTADSGAASAKSSTGSPQGTTSIVSPECLDVMLRYAWAVIRGDKTDALKYQQAFKKSSCDGAGWLSAAFDYLVAYELKLKEPISYVSPPVPPSSTRQFIYALPEQLSFRIGILGDWATGEQVARYVINALMEQKPDLILHVGDVYYAGTSDEVQTNYLEQIRIARAATGCLAPIYNLAGNHDMYTKGAPFYSALAQVNEGARFPSSPAATVHIQEASFFVLSNSWLHLKGMDTGYYDSDLFDISYDTTMLHEDEAIWHIFQMQQAQDKAVFLFSHHQPWSAFSPIDSGAGVAGHPLPLDDRRQPFCYNQNLQRQLATVPVGRVKAWFWGHEHVLEVYDADSIRKSTVPPDDNNPSTVPLSSLFPWVPYGAGVGFSGSPRFGTDEPYKHRFPNITFNANYKLGTVPTPDNTVYNHGFTILDAASSGSATATYYWLNGDGSSPAVTQFPTVSVVSP